MEQRAALVALADEHGVSLAELSRVLRRNAAYLQQFVTRGTPRMLAEADRSLLARYFGVPEARLGAREPEGLVEVPRLDIRASAGRGALAEDDLARQPGQFGPGQLRAMGVRPAAASLIRVRGDSMSATLEDGDEILVDCDRRTIDRGIFVVRVDGELLVKRLRPAVGGIELVSDNPAYPPRFVRGGSIEIIGKVAWLGRALG